VINCSFFSDSCRFTFSQSSSRFQLFTQRLVRHLIAIVTGFEAFTFAGQARLARNASNTAAIWVALSPVI
jgi:hypothetical protein